MGRANHYSSHLHAANGALPRGGGGSAAPYSDGADSSLFAPRIYRPLDGDPRRPPPDDTFSYTAETSTVTEEKSTCLSWVKYGIFAANIVMIVAGTAILAIGSWLRTDSRFRDFLSERYRQAVEEAFWQAPTLYAFSYILIVLGGFMIVTAFFGCCGAAGFTKIFVGIYVCFLVAIFIATVSAGIFLFYKKDGLDVELSDALNYMVQHYYQGPSIVQESLDRLQQAFRCCGNAGCSDFRAFRQDPPRTCDIRCDGCHYRIWHALTVGFSAALVVFFFVLLMQVVAFSLSLYLLLRPAERVRVLYISDHANAAYESSTPSTHPVPLTRDVLERHNLPYALRKYRAARNYRY